MKHLFFLSKRTIIARDMGGVLFVLMIAFLMTNCKKDDTKPQPTIASFTPASGHIGATVTITGANFKDGATSNLVKFNGVDAVITSASITEIVATVPSGATTGKITVIAGGITGTSTSDFTVLAPQTITSFAPSSGMIGATVTISGTDFSTTTTDNVVKFNGVTATVTTATSTALTVTVPTGATTGKISVTINGTNAVSSSDFSVIIPPTITSFAPTSGVVGSTITITGTNFSTTSIADNIVKINGTLATVTAATATTLTITVPTGATTGKIKVTLNGIDATSSSDFTVPLPTITSFTPAYALPGATVTIVGTNFANGSLTLNNVKVNNVDATVTSATDTQLTIAVPATTTGAIAINVGGQTVTSTNTFEVLLDIPRTGLVAFYPFNGNPNDASGNNLNGTAVNGPTLSADRYQNSNKSYLLDGTNDYIDLGNPTQLQISDKITISIWVNLSAFTFQTILGKFGYTGASITNGYDMRADMYSALGNKTYFSFRSFLNSSAASFVVGGNPELAISTWYQVTLVIDHGTWTFYKNGAQTNQIVGTSSLLGDGTGGKLVIGGVADNAGVISSFFHGAVDDIAIYNRALSAAEVTQLYQQTITKH